MYVPPLWTDVSIKLKKKSHLLPVCLFMQIDACLPCAPFALLSGRPELLYCLLTGCVLEGVRRGGRGGGGDGGGGVRWAIPFIQKV